MNYVVIRNYLGYSKVYIINKKLGRYVSNLIWFKKFNRIVTNVSIDRNILCTIDNKVVKYPLPKCMDLTLPITVCDWEAYEKIDRYTWTINVIDKPIDQMKEGDWGISCKNLPIRFKDWDKKSDTITAIDRLNNESYCSYHHCGFDPIDPEVAKWYIKTYYKALEDVSKIYSKDKPYESSVLFNTPIQVSNSNYIDAIVRPKRNYHVLGVSIPMNKTYGDLHKDLMIDYAEKDGMIHHFTFVDPDEYQGIILK